MYQLKPIALRSVAFDSHLVGERKLIEKHQNQIFKVSSLEHFEGQVKDYG